MKRFGLTLVHDTISDVFFDLFYAEWSKKLTNIINKLKNNAYQTEKEIKYFNYRFARYKIRHKLACKQLDKYVDDEVKAALQKIESFIEGSIAHR